MITEYTPSSETQICDRIFSTPIPGLLFLEHSLHTDERGFYKEITLLPDLEPFLPTPFIPKQINQARSHTYVTRGMHAEQWNKLVTVTQGHCFCALADIRPDSPTFADVVTFNLGTEKNCILGSLFVPSGVANSLTVVSGPVDYIYVVDQLYRDRDTQGDLSISLFDTDLAIKWPTQREKMIISQRDTDATTLRKKFPHKF